MKQAEPELIRQIAMGNMDALVNFMKDAKEHSVEVMLGASDRESLPEHRSEIKTLHELIKLIETAPETARQIENLADSETGSASPGDLQSNSF